MKIELTARELFDLGIWEDFCDITGTSLWAMKDGKITDETTFTLDKYQMQRLFGKRTSCETRRLFWN